MSSLNEVSEFLFQTPGVVCCSRVRQAKLLMTQVMVYAHRGAGGDGGGDELTNIQEPNDSQPVVAATALMMEKFSKLGFPF